MKGTLVLAILNVKSSYANNTEFPLDDDDDVPDTLQWWITADRAFRIKTFAVDHDIHTHEIGGGGQSMVDLALANNSKHYGDVISCQHILALEDCGDQQAVANALRDVGLAASLEVAPGRFAFWNPDGAEYRSQSHPQ